MSAGNVVAQKASQARKTRSADNKDAPRRNTTPLAEEQIERALGFAQEHHSDLAELLGQLRNNSPAGFDRGIREVHRAVVRLDRFREKQPTRHTYELARWKTDSRIRLLTARWVMSQDPSLEKQIRMMLKKRQQARLERLTADHKKAAERLKQLDEQIAEASAESALTDEWERLRKRAVSQAGTRRSKKSTKSDETVK